MHTLLSGVQCRHLYFKNKKGVARSVFVTAIIDLGTYVWAHTTLFIILASFLPSISLSRWTSLHIWFLFSRIFSFRFSKGLEEYIQEVLDDVTDVARRVAKCRENAKTIKNIMVGWSKSPLWQRKDGKKDALLSLDDRQERLSKRYLHRKALKAISFHLSGQRDLNQAFECTPHCLILKRCGT
jgi:hypothetical protein